MTAADPASDAIVAHRYHLIRRLGRGSAAEVYEAFDRRQSRHVALKRLFPEAIDRHPSLVDFFQSEFQLLSQLCHPQIIEVYDYGLDGSSPYYTMEMLRGSDLKEAAPVRWQRACEILCEVASSLAILHARRLLHNDLSSKNVRLTADGRAKLIDFGAVSPMGIRDYVVGTPAFVPPEAVHAQPLDARSDLFSLGALAYWLLTRKLAFPARKHRELAALWQHPPAPLSSLAPDAPDTLGDLVAELISIDPRARPSSAAEVIDRLSAIAGLPAAEDLGIAQSYLTTPTLIAREDLLARFRQQLRRAGNGRGGSLVIDGEPGMGKTRLLSSYELEAKLAGMLVLRATAQEITGGEHAVLSTLLGSLCETVPDPLLRECVTPRLPLLRRLIPDLRDDVASELLEGEGSAAAANEADEDGYSSSQLERAALHCLLDLAERRGVMIAVDDAHRCDVDSAAVLARLAHSAENRRLMVVVTTELGASARAPRALEMLEQAGTRVRLHPLGSRETEALLESIFGKVDNVNVAASWVHKLAGGNPKASMELAQHLVDTGVAGFEAGTWRLPAKLRGQTLPRSLSQALEIRLAALSPDAWTLAQGLALATDHAPLRANDCIELLARGGDERDDLSHRAFRALGDLVAQQFVSQADGRYCVAHRSVREAIRSRLDGSALRAVHAALARAYRARPETNPAVVAFHLHRCGEDAEALRWTLSWVGDLDWDRRSDLQLLMSPLAREILESALACAEASGASGRDLYALRRCLLDLALRVDPAAIVHSDAVFEQLRRESGLVFWEELEEQAPSPAERIQHCMRRAQERYDACPEGRRGLTPIEALQAFARCASTTSAVSGRIQDLDWLSANRDVLLPLRDLSPVAAAMHEIVQSTADSWVFGLDVMGRTEDLLETLNSPLPGMSDDARASAKHTVTYYWALDRVTRSTPEALLRADYLESKPSFEAMAWQIRKLWYLCNGDVVEAKRCGRQMELLAIGNVESHMALATSLGIEMGIFATAGDLMGLKRILPQIEQQAQRFPGWQSSVHLGKGLIHSLREEHAAAHAELGACLALVSPGCGGLIWMRAMGADLAALVGLGAYESVKTKAQQSLDEVEDLRTRPLLANRFEIPLAYSEARLGEADAAARRLDDALARSEDAQLAPLYIGELLEARARLAIWSEDADAFASFSGSLEAHYCAGQYPALAARFGRLMKEADRAGLACAARPAPSPAPDAHAARFTPAEIWNRLDQCRGTEERAEAALQILVEATGAEDGYLYTLREEGPCVVASLHGNSPPVAIDDLVADSLSSALSDVTEYSTPESIALGNATANETSLVLLSVPRDSGELVLGAAALRNGVRPVAAQAIGTICECLLSAGDVAPPSSAVP